MFDLFGCITQLIILISLMVIGTYAIHVYIKKFHPKLDDNTTEKFCPRQTKAMISHR